MKRDSDGQGKHVQWNEDNLAENEQIKLSLNTTKIDEPKTPYVHGIEPDAAEVAGMSPLSLDGDDHFVETGPEHLILQDMQLAGQRPPSAAYANMFAPECPDIPTSGASIGLEQLPVQGHSPTLAEEQARRLGRSRVSFSEDTEAGAPVADAAANALADGDPAPDLHRDPMQLDTGATADAGDEDAGNAGPLGPGAPAPVRGWSPSTSGGSPLDGRSDDEGRGDKRHCFELHRKAHYDMRAALQRGRQLLDDEDEEDVTGGVNTVQTDIAAGSVDVQGPQLPNGSCSAAAS